MNDRSPLTPPRPGSSPILTPEGIICGTDGKYRWVTQPFRSSACTLFTMDEHAVSRRRVKGRAGKDEVVHAFTVWVGGQSQPALRFYPPKSFDLGAVRHITVHRARGLILLRRGWSRFVLSVSPEQLDPVLDFLRLHCPPITIQ